MPLIPTDYKLFNRIWFRHRRSKTNLSQDLVKLSEWFDENCRILNPDKRQHMCLRKYIVSDLLQFCGEDLKASDLKTVLGIEIDNKLNFQNNLKAICSKAS